MENPVIRWFKRSFTTVVFLAVDFLELQHPTPVCLELLATAQQRALTRARVHEHISDPVKGTSRRPCDTRLCQIDDTQLLGSIWCKCVKICCECEELFETK